ncbi:MAG TPA: hypothetical protein PK466_01305 [Thermotogota bacterium]|nr:hypothetical protein [Thermotogota bacterium]HPJ87623.1 hypothetical protein [Thermotogota bacterium]HPR94939.1 hypothetical protein [Thermotogota bacterium]
MSHYKKILELFEEVKDRLDPLELQYLLNQIEEYDSCVDTDESRRIEDGLIRFCEKKIQKMD